MVRVVVQSVDAGAAIHVGGPVEVGVKTFDVEAPELEAFLQGGGSYSSRNVIGAEVVRARGETTTPGTGLGGEEAGR